MLTVTPLRRRGRILFSQLLEEIQMMLFSGKMLGVENKEDPDLSGSSFRFSRLRLQIELKPNQLVQQFY